MKWQILYKMPNYSTWKQKIVVIACLVVHNFIREHNSEDLDFAWFYHYPHFVSIILEQV